MSLHTPSYDSRPETYEHITVVRGYLLDCAMELIRRADVHDQSKLEAPELEAFDTYTPKLKDTVYGSAQYKRYLQLMKPALGHHYANNRHHPEFHKDGILGMNLLDLTEMLCDWAAAVRRSKDGDLLASIETLNQERFDYDDQIKRLLLNTVRDLGLA